MTASPPEPDWKNYYEMEAFVQEFHLETDAVEIHRCLAAWSVFPRRLQMASLLDAGCGNGYFCYWISQRMLFQQVCGVDLSTSRIEIARQRYPSFEFQAVPLENLPWSDNAFDVVTCIEVLEHVPEPLLVVRELLRMASRYLVLTVPDRNPIRRVLCPHCGKTFPMYGHTHSFSIQSLEKLLVEAGGQVEVIRPFFAARGADEACRYHWIAFWPGPGDISCPSALPSWRRARVNPTDLYIMNPKICMQKKTP